MTTGPYGVWDRGQTWWPMAEGYHRYISRCQFILQQGRTVADILYLTPEGAPHVFRPPSSAMTGDEVLPDRRGYNFDGCSLGQLYKAFVKDNQIIRGGDFNIKKANELYPSYDLTAKLLNGMGVAEDFKSAAPIRYTHRTTPDWDIYFVSNRTNEPIKGDCIFRTTKASPELWDPLTGKIRKLPQFSSSEGVTTVSLEFDALQSFFIVFRNHTSGALSERKNFSEKTEIASLNGPWNVSFDPKWGGPEKVVRFDSLKGWNLRPEEGIKYYSGIAGYRKHFDLLNAISKDKNKRLYLDLGEVKNLARVMLNGKDLGVVWTAPWKVEITEAVKQKGNTLEIEVANLWPNRLIGDEKLPEDGIKNRAWPDWLIKGEKRTSGRNTFTTYRNYTKDSPLLKSGLIGPVTIQRESFQEKLSKKK